ncbi:MAG: hypothetical protein R3Y56_10050 [Akkermansia sp.]
MPFFLLQALFAAPYCPDNVDAIRLAAINPFSSESAPLLHELTNWVNLFESYQQYLLQLCENSYLIAAFAALSQWIVFVSIGTCFSIVCLPKGEYKRIFSPLAACPSDLKVAKQFIIPFILLSLIIGGIYGWAANYATSFSIEQLPQWRIRAQVLGDKAVIKIGDEFFKRDFKPVFLDWNKRKLALEEKYKALYQEQESQLFGQIERNVDTYLDWHYGLGAEYLRTLSLGSDTAKDFIKNKYQELIFAKIDYSGIEQVLSQYHSELDLLNQEMAKLKKEYSVNVPVDVNIIELDKGMTTKIEDRVIVSAISGLAAGGIAGVLTAKVTKKLMQKAIGKIIIKQLIKAGVSKVAAAAAGAAAGGTAGSVVPLIGTAVGAAVGAGIGLAADYFILKADEHFNREEYRRELIQIIHETISEQFQIAH